MTHTQFLKKLGAPLRSTRESWGSVRDSDRAVFLLIWQDQTRRIGDEQFSRITARGKLLDDDGFGAKERLEHIELIKEGASSYLIVCIAKDVTNRPRTVSDFISDRVFIGGEIVEHDNELWIRLDRAIPSNEALCSSSPLVE